MDGGLQSIVSLISFPNVKIANINIIEVRMLNSSTLRVPYIPSSWYVQESFKQVA